MLVLDLFSGIGGASLGLHWAGMRTVAFCERDAACARVLARHWPGVPVYPDIRTLSAARLRADGVPRAGLLVGGFPCQDISPAGRGAGLAGARPGCGTRWPAWSPNADRAGWWLRTFLLCESGARTGCSVTWRHSATPAGRSWWVLSMPGRRTGGAGPGSWPGGLLPTPRARDWKCGSAAQRGRRRACPLNDVVGGRLSPGYVEWIMGFPAGWTG